MRDLLPNGVSYERCRSAGLSAHRLTGDGAGKLLIAEAIKHCHHLFGEGPIRIGAQLYLKKFYESFGFVQTSEVYLEDGIDHIE